MSVCIKSLIKNVNLIVGCDIGCPYCYARNNCRRFHMTDDFSKPVFFRNKLHILDNKQPHVWFMTGLSDFTGWLPEWREEIFVSTSNAGITMSHSSRCSLRCRRTWICRASIGW